MPIVVVVPAAEAKKSGYIFNSGNVIDASFVERRDTVFNEIWVYGDRYLDGFKEEFTAGSPLGGSIFTLLHKPHSTIVNLGTPITVNTQQKGGILNLNIIPVSGTDYLVNFNDRQIVFASGTDLGYSSIPASGTLVTVDYFRLLPIVKAGRDTNSISRFKRRVKVIVDKNIKEPSTAVDRLKSELQQFSTPRKEGTIKVKGLFDVIPSQTIEIKLPNQNIDGTFNVIETRYNFNKISKLTEQVMTIKVNKKVDDITDKIKELDEKIKRIEAQDMDPSDVLTRLQFTLGSFGIRQSGLIISTRTLGSSFVLGVPPHGVTGATWGGTLGSIVASGINFLGDSRGPLTIHWSGGFF